MMFAVLLAAWLAAAPPDSSSRPGDRADSSSQAGVEFRWDAPAECPSEAEVLAQLERLLGGRVADQGERRLAAIARVRRETDGRWDLRLWTITEDATSQRSLSGEDCVVLAEAAALLAAMAIDPSVLTRGDASPAAVEQAEQAEAIEGGEPAPEPQETVEVAQPEPDPPEPDPPKSDPPATETDPSKPEPSPRRQRRFIVAIGANTGFSYGDLPGIGPILRVGVAMQWLHARVEIEGHYGFVRHARFNDGDDVGADLRHGMAIARGCGVLNAREAKLEFPICLGLEGGALSGQGVGFTVIQDGVLPWAAVDLAAGLAWAPIRRLAIGLRVEPFVALVRGRFVAEGIAELWRPLPLGVRAVVGLEVRF